MVHRGDYLITALWKPLHYLCRIQPIWAIKEVGAATFIHTHEQRPWFFSIRGRVVSSKADLPFLADLGVAVTVGWMESRVGERNSKQLNCWWTEDFVLISCFIPYLEVALVPAILGQGVPQLFVTPNCLQHVWRRLCFARRLAVRGRVGVEKNQLSVTDIGKPAGKWISEAHRRLRGPLCNSW